MIKIKVKVRPNALIWWRQTDRWFAVEKHLVCNYNKIIFITIAVRPWQLQVQNQQAVMEDSTDRIEHKASIYNYI